MKIIFILVVIMMMITPLFTFAYVCNDKGITVIFVNGIFSSKSLAIADKDLLESNFLDRNPNKDIVFINGFNESHLKGGGDLAKSVMQAYGLNGLDYDLTNILIQAHSELSTRKVLLVGHSQGTFYTNAAYDYLVQNGVPKESISVYNIATPADKVAGGGNYLTSSTDKVINSIVRELATLGSALKPLPANIDITLSADENKDSLGGHSLSTVYLKSVPDRIVGDMQTAINNLSENDDIASLDNGCFTAPKITLSHLIMGMGFEVSDNISADMVNLFGQLAKIGSQKISDALVYIYNFGKTFNISSLFIASLTSSNSQDAPQSEDLQNLDITEVSEQNPSENQIAINSNNKQDQIDDILEKLDILRRQIAELSENTDINNNIPKIQQKNSVIGNTTYGAIGANVSYSKILISEVQMAGLTDEKEEFVELYNPNTTEIDLTNWYLQKKTKTGSSYSTYVPSTLFSGKKIGANSYFIIARENSSFTSLANIITENSLAEDNSLILKNPNGEISDKLGFGQAQEYETAPVKNPEKGQSIGRKWDVPGNIEQDTDNNLLDFEAQNSTPKAKNITFVIPPNIPPQAPIDGVAPEAIFSLDEVQANLTFAINFTITDPITTVSPSGIDSYTFRWQKDGDSWQEDSAVKVSGNPASVTLTRDFTGHDETIYYFQIKVKDVSGNESDWQPEVPATTKISIFKKVLINEVQTKGVTVKDEFIELYNPNDVDMDLSSFELKKKTFSATNPGGTESNLVSSNKFSGLIKAKGFLLITPQKNNDGTENYTGSVLPDLRYSGVSSSFAITDNNTVLIYNKGGVSLDKVGFGTAKDFETAPTVNHPTGKSIERKKLGQDTDDNSADFRISDEPTPRSGSPKSYIQDITDYENSMSSSGNIYYYNLKIKWGSNSSNIDFYDVQYKVNNGDWQDWVLKTTDTEKIYKVYNSIFTDYVYQFRVRAQDKEGNHGDWAEITMDATNPIVINEVALFGTNASRSDQWIELYNKTDKDVDLTGWRILLHSGFYHTLQGVIPAKGYFILEFNDDNPISDISANQFFIGSVDGFSVALVNQNNRQIDKFYVPIGLGRSGWLDSDFKKDENYYSMERISPYSFGSNIMNWRINNGIIINGIDKNRNPIYGTPGQQNSNYQIYTSLSEDFVENTTLPLSLSPYLIVWSHLSVYKDKILTIDPGVIIKFQNFYGYAGLKVEGTLNAVGTAEQKIVFTSVFDDEYGGDIDNNYPQASPLAGNWAGLQFTKDATNLSELDNVLVRYAGSPYPEYSDLKVSGIIVDQSSISLKNSVIEKNFKSGVLLVNSSSIIDNVSFLDNEIVPGYDQRDGVGVYIYGGNPQILNSYFKRNVYGVKMQSWWDSDNKEFLPFPTFENNNFEGNTFDIWDDNTPTPVLPLSLNNVEEISNEAVEVKEPSDVIEGADTSNSQTTDEIIPEITSDNTTDEMTDGAIIDGSAITQTQTSTDDITGKIIIDNQ